MSIEKKYLKTKPLCKVKFSLTGDPYIDAISVHVVGDFNEWRPGVHSMKKSKSGDWSVQIDLPAGAPYQFRYLVDETVWDNDPDADGTVDNGMGSENSVLEL